MSEVTPAAVDNATGSNAQTGASDWSQPGGPVVKGEVVPDPDRRPLTRQEFVEAIAADADGHGLGNLPIPFKTSFTCDVPGTKLQFCVVRMASETGGDQGLLRRPELQAFLIPALP